MWNKSRQNFFLVFTVFVIALLGFLFGEKIPSIGLYGDEIGYTRLAKDFYGEVFDVRQNSYHLQKMLPSALVYHLLALFSIPKTNLNILNTFGICNMVLLTLMAYVWCLIADQLKITTRGKWLGALGLFINFAVLKYAMYVPISIDVFGYALGLFMFYFYLTGNSIMLYVLFMLSIITWPTLGYVGLILLIFPREKEETRAYQPAPFFIHNAVGAIAAGFLLYKMYVFFFAAGADRMFSSGIFTTGANKPIQEVIPLSAVVALGFIFFGIREIANNQKFYQPRYWLKQIRPVWAVVALGTMLAIKAALFSISVRRDRVYSFSYLLKDTLGDSLIQPGAFFIAHVIYYGPLIILLLFLWRPVCRLIQDQGMGLTIAIAVCVIISLNSESRKIINFYPFLLPFLIKVIDDLDWRDSPLWFLGGLSFLFSKVWLKIHVAPWGRGPLEFPNQLYFMNLGPWMSHQMYVVQGAVVLLAGLLIYIVMIMNRGAQEHKSIRA